MERLKFHDERIGDYDEAEIINEKIKQVEKAVDKEKLRIMKEKHIQEVKRKFLLGFEWKRAEIQSGGRVQRRGKRFQ